MRFNKLSKLVSEMPDFKIDSISTVVARLAEDAGLKVTKVVPHDYETWLDEFELFFDNGLVMYLSVSQDGNVVWHDFRKSFEMGNMKQPDRITDNFYKIKDGGGMHDSLSFDK